MSVTRCLMAPPNYHLNHLFIRCLSVHRISKDRFQSIDKAAELKVKNGHKDCSHQHENEAHESSVYYTVYNNRKTIKSGRMA